MIFESPPKDFNPKFEIVSCFLKNQNEFLLLQSNHAKKYHAGKWGVPAGKVNVGEALGDALAREVEEETGIKVIQKELIFFETVFVRHQGYDFAYNMFVINCSIRPKVKISPEHINFVWISPKKSLKLDLIDDEGACIKRWAKL